jgi:glutamine amidotransferase
MSSENDSRLDVIAEVLEQTFETVSNLLKESQKTGCSYYNICLSDGKRLIASRYCTDSSVEPESLHYLKGTYFWSEKEFLQNSKSKVHPGVLIASEQLTDINSQWHLIPKSHFILVEQDYTVQLKPIK